MVLPRVSGHGPTLFAGLSKRIDLRLVSRLEFGSGAVAAAEASGTGLSVTSDLQQRLACGRVQEVCEFGVEGARRDRDHSLATVGRSIWVSWINY